MSYVCGGGSLPWGASSGAAWPASLDAVGPAAASVGVLDGSAGVMYATLHSFYEFLIEVKCRELIRRREGKPL